MSDKSGSGRVFSVIAKDILHSSRASILIFAVLVPLIATLVISAVVDSSVLGQPRLGLVDLGASELVGRIAQRGHLAVSRYEDTGALRRAVERGDLEAGAVLPQGLDEALAAGDEPSLELYIWGESLENQRALITASLAREARALAGQAPPVEVVTSEPAEPPPPWEERLFPLVVIMIIVYGGMLIPATTLVKEKQANTLRALTATPMSLTELLVAKGLTGMTVSIVMAVVILALNNAFGAQPALLVGIIVLNAVLAAELGIIIGLFVGNIITLFAVIEGIGIMLIAPALFYLFPDLPEWVARLFPTFYMLAPIVEMGLHDALWPDIAGKVYILIALIAVTTVAGVLVARWRGGRD